MSLKKGDTVEIIKDLCSFRKNKYIGKVTTIKGIKKNSIIYAYKLKNIEDIWFENELKFIHR